MGDSKGHAHPLTRFWGIAQATPTSSTLRADSAGPAHSLYAVADSAGHAHPLKADGDCEGHAHLLQAEGGQRRPRPPAPSCCPTAQATPTRLTLMAGSEGHAHLLHADRGEQRLMGESEGYAHPLQATATIASPWLR